MSGNMLTTIKGDYFPVYTNSESLHYTSETKYKCQLYLKKKKWGGITFQIVKQIF